MKLLIIANWKMNPQSLVGARWLFNSIKKGVKNVRNVEVVICPPFVYLQEMRDKKQTARVKLGGQDCFWEEKGAFTGEISPFQLKNLGCQYVIIGHSERRKYFSEPGTMINKKIKAALAIKLKPIFCVGENRGERRKGETKKIIRFQIRGGLKNISQKDLKNLILAYEPVWAIGSGNPCHPLQAKEVFSFLRRFLKRNPILYGGSVNSQNALSYIKAAGFQGLLVGGASLDPKEFIKIVKNTARY
ncbi:MAG: triose-phosphate isomerase [Candidatus Paceibacterales bacterium]